MDTSEYRVTLNGSEIAARVLSLRGQPQEPISGDVLFTRAVPPMVLGEERAAHLRESGRETGLLLVESDTEFPNPKIACRVGHAWIKRSGARLPAVEGGGEKPGDSDDNQKVFVNPLTDLSAAELARLRGIRLEAWDPVLETYLHKIDPERCVLSIDSEVLRACGGGLPPLPGGLRYLLFQFTSWGSDDEFDLSSLSKFPALRALVLPSAPVEIDMGFLAGAKHLRVLHASGTRISGLQGLADFHDLRDLDLGDCDSVDDDSSNAIGALTQLRRLDLAGCGKLTSVEFVRSLPRLEFIDLRETAVTDLAALADLPSLKEIVAIRAPVRILPTRQIPSLHSLNVMSTGLEAEAVAAFRQLHPDAEVLHGWADALRGTVTGSSHVRVRSGGTCHRHPDKERTLLDESNEAAVEMLTLSFEVDEAQSGGHCRCCGSPTIEFTRDGELVAEIGLHHGRSARWKGWPGDAVLTRRSRSRLATWLSERGERSFSEAHEETCLLESAEEAVAEDCLRVLPPKSAAFWKASGSRASEATGLSGMADFSGGGPSVVTVRGPSLHGGEGTDRQAMAAMIEEELGDPVRIAAIAFQLLGCGEGSWNHVPRGGLHGVALDMLKSVERPARGSALQSMALDANGWEGSVRWVLYHGGFDSIPPDVLRGHIERAFRHALSHPREFNRRHALALLGTGDGPFVVAMLREVLNDLPVRKADPRHATEPGGWVVSQGDRSSVPDGASDSAVAAHLLAKLDDQGSYDKVCELALRATEPSRSVLLEAKVALEQRKVRRKSTLLARAGALLKLRGRRLGPSAKEP